jgi:hypothetical protein
MEVKQNAATIAVIGILVVIAILVVRVATNTCGVRHGRACTAVIQHTAAPVQFLDLIKMEEYWDARTNPLAVRYLPNAPCLWEPRFEGFIQRGLKRAKDLGLAPAAMPRTDVKALVDFCFNNACTSDGPTNLPTPKPWKSPPGHHSPGVCE